MSAISEARQLQKRNVSVEDDDAAEIHTPIAAATSPNRPSVRATTGAAG
jgi:hypothetical protein